MERGIYRMNIKMNVTEIESKGIELFGLKENFTYEELVDAYNDLIQNKYKIAMVKTNYSVDDIEATLNKTYEALKLYLCKRNYFGEMINWYFKDIEKKDGYRSYCININENTIKLLDVNVITDTVLLFDTLFSHLSSFNNAISQCDSVEKIRKVFRDYVVVFELDINDYKKGNLGSKARMLNSFKDKINANFAKGSKDYQDLTNCFLNLLGIKSYENFVKAYDLGVLEINKRIYDTDFDEKIKSTNKKV